jgi:hypothetical protein
MLNKILQMRKEWDLPMGFIHSIETRKSIVFLQYLHNYINGQLKRSMPRTESTKGFPCDVALYRNILALETPYWPADSALIMVAIVGIMRPA